MKTIKNLNRLTEQSKVMGLQNSHQHSSEKYKNSKWCFKCKSNTHDTKQCRRFCTFHKSDTHWTKDCRHQNKHKHQAKSAKHQLPNSDRDQHSQEEHSYFFMVDNETKRELSSPKLLVDSGATVHILNDKKHFESFDEHFCH